MFLHPIVLLGQSTLPSITIVYSIIYVIQLIGSSLHSVLGSTLNKHWYSLRNHRRLCSDLFALGDLL